MIIYIIAYLLVGGMFFGIYYAVVEKIKSPKGMDSSLLTFAIIAFLIFWPIVIVIAIGIVSRKEIAR